MSSQLQDQISKLTDQLAHKKAQLLLKEQAAKNKQLVLSRRERDKRNYKLGGMVEKMGLDQLPEEALLGALAFMNRNISKPEFLAKMASDGQPYLVVGKKLARPTLPQVTEVQS